MSLISFNNKVIEFEKSVKRSKVRSIRKLTRKIESENKKNPNDERTSRRVKRIIDEIHCIRKLPNKDVVLFAMENEGTIAEILQKYKPNSDDLKQHALIRLATEKSLQSDIKSFKTDDVYAQSWQQLLIMYSSRYEKRLAWKQKSKDFQKIEEALIEQQKELDEIEKTLPKPLKLKTKTEEKQKSLIKRSKQAVVCVLDLENKTAEPFGHYASDDDGDDDDNNKDEKILDNEETKPIDETEKSTNESKLNSSSTSINDPFFLNSQHQISYQKRTSRNKDDPDVDDKGFIEHSYFVDALSSSSNRRDGRGDFARKKWAHLSFPTRSHMSKNQPKESETKTQSKPKETNHVPLHPSWEASRQAKTQYAIRKSEGKKITFNDGDDESS